jgi:light-regulated signal transduction histidine kinase (bacteriophytochrome)
VPGDIENVQEMTAVVAADRGTDDVRFQQGGFFLELSLDWIVLRASENIHHLFGESHVTLIDEPLGRFVHSQALHDLRNLFSRLSGMTGIGRAYRVRLTDDHDLVDVAFQLSDGRVLFEAVASSGTFGEAFGSVGGLIAGLAQNHGHPLLDGGARRMRALTGYDRVTACWGDERAESSRGPFAGAADLTMNMPAIVNDTDADAVGIFPRRSEDTSVADALMHAPDVAALDQLRRAGVRSSLGVPFEVEDRAGEFRCDSRSARAPSVELHAAAELFAQLFAMRLEIEHLRNA